MRNTCTIINVLQTAKRLKYNDYGLFVLFPVTIVCEELLEMSFRSHATSVCYENMPQNTCIIQEVLLIR